MRALERLSRCFVRLAFVSFPLAISVPASGQCEFQKILASDAAALDQFGDAVAMSGDLAVVGASRDDDLGSASGAAYVLEFDGQIWRESAKLLAWSDGEANDLFGWSVDIDAFAADGPVIVVGAYRDDHAGGLNAGAAYVFRYDGMQWIEEAKLTADDAGGGDEFGESVAVSGDRIAIGAPRDDDGGSNAGAAYIFAFNGAVWAQETKLVAPEPVAQDQLGSSVDIDGDAVVVGAPLNDHAGISSGAAHAFRYGGAEWMHEQVITADDASEGDRFGEAVSISFDLVLVGAPFDDDLAANSGSAYVFRFDGAWLPEVKLTAPDAMMDDNLGLAVSISDGPAEDDDVALIGAPNADLAAGAAELFFFDGADWIHQARLASTTGAAGDQFGNAVAMNDEFLLLGANRDDDDVLGDDVGAAVVVLNTTDALEDCNDNGIDDVCEIGQGLAQDCNGNAVPDDCDIADGASNDLNGNGVPDECEDCNANGIPDAIDIDDGTSVDCNGNGLPDECEIDENSQAPGGPYYCTEDCDPDCNVNGVPDECDIASGFSEDCNANGIPDSCDVDSGFSADCNEDGVPDECQTDCNENGVPDDCDIDDGTSEDCNANGVPDECDLDDGTLHDVNGNGVPDECEDCDGNGWPDFLDIFQNPELDCNDNGILDVCEISEDSDAPGGPFYCTENCDPDCNVNGVPDACDIADGTSADCNENGIPDECEIHVDTPGGPFFCTEDCAPDCNANGVPDECDLADGTSEDANGNGRPDECEDRNGNGVLDPEDIANGTSLDCNGNGIPDECDVDPDDPDGDGSVSGDCNDNEIPDECDIAEGTELDLDEDGIPDQCEDCNGNGDPDPWEILFQGLADCNENGIPDECEIDEDSEAPGGPFFCTEDCDPDCNINGIPDACDIADGTSEDANANGIPDECESAGDVNGDGVVNVQDLLLLLGAWGMCPEPPIECPEDLNDDGSVDVLDLLVVLGNWG
jgi:hypothetical protein